jgi:transposase
MPHLQIKRKNDLKRLERVNLQKIHKKTLRKIEAIRLRAAGKTPLEIARLLGVHVNTVRHWIHLFNQAGLQALDYKHSGGRPRRLSRAQEEQVIAWLKAGAQDGERWTLKKLSARLFDQYGVVISQQQLSARIRDLGESHLLAKPRRNASQKRRRSGA